MALDNRPPSPKFTAYPGLLRIRNPKIQVIVLLLMLVMVGGVMFWLHTVMQPGPEAPGRHSPTTPMEQAAGPDLTGVPVLDPALADKIADSGPDARRRIERDALDYLLLEVRTTPAVAAYERDLFPLVPGSGEQIEKDSRPWRFKYFEFRGELEYFREEDYDTVYRGGEKSEAGLVRRGRVRIVEGGKAIHAVFLTPFLPMTQAPDYVVGQPRVPVPIESGWVRARGIFVKNYVDTGADGVEVPGFFFVVTQLYQDYETLPVTTLEAIPFQEIEDDPSLAGDPSTHNLLFNIYPRLHFRLLKYAERRAGEAGASLRAEEKLVPADFTPRQRFEEALHQPARFRAKYVGGFGALVGSILEEGWDPRTANDAGVEEYLSGMIITDGEMLLRFTAPISLVGRAHSNDRVYYEGYFYKTWGYYARNGTEQLVPWLVLTDLRSIPPVKRDTRYDVVIAGAVVVVLGVFLWIVVREDKTKQSFRAERRKRQADRAGRQDS